MTEPINNTDSSALKEKESLSLTLETNLDAFDILKERLIDMIGMSPAAFNVILACEEIFVNITEYSEASQTDVLCTLSRDRLEVCFEDCGKEFDPTSFSVNEKEFEEYDDGGMGLMLVKKIASSCIYIRQENKNILRLIFDL